MQINPQAQSNKATKNLRSCKDPGLGGCGKKKIFLGVVSGLPQVINSRFNLSASLFISSVQSRRASLPTFLESELLATGPASLGIHEALDPYTCKASCGSRHREGRASACSRLLTYASLTSWYAVACCLLLSHNIFPSLAKLAFN